jgi:hypothetical protein
MGKKIVNAIPDKAFHREIKILDMKVLISINILVTAKSL